MKKLCYLSCALFVFILSCRQTENAMPIQEYQSGEGLLIDVRTPMEYELGHMAGAVNIDWKSQDFTRAFDTISKDQTLYLYCQKGGRSAKAAHHLDSLGFDVVNLVGGYERVQP